MTPGTQVGAAACRRPSSPSEPSHAALTPLSAGTPTPAVLVARPAPLSLALLVEPWHMGACERSAVGSSVPAGGGRTQSLVHSSSLRRSPLSDQEKLREVSASPEMLSRRGAETEAACERGARRLWGQDRPPLTSRRAGPATSISKPCPPVSGGLQPPTCQPAVMTRPRDRRVTGLCPLAF